MKKLNEVIYNKLLLQAEEAKEQGMVKLASDVMEAIGPLHEEESVTYSYGELNSEINNGLWKLATNVLKYHDLNKADIESLDEKIQVLANKFIEEIEKTLKVDNSKVGPLEPKLIGEE